MWCVSNPAQSRYRVRMLVAAVLCILFAALAAAAFNVWHLMGAVAWVVAVVSALPIVGALVGTGAYLNEEKDEFQRNLYIQAILGGIAGTLAATTIWGYLEDFARAPHMRLIWVCPMFWIFVVVVFPVIRLRYR
jgi:MFS family permease